MVNFILMILAMVLVSVLALPVLILNIARKIFRKEELKKYFLSVAVGFDQVGGSILYGQEDWTVSSWTYRLEMKGNREAGYFRKFIDFFFGYEHCENSFIKEAQELNFRERSV